MLVLHHHRLLRRRNLGEDRRNLGEGHRHHRGVGLRLDAVRPHQLGVVRPHLGDQEHQDVDHLGDPFPAKEQMGYYPAVKLDEEFPYPELQQTGCCLDVEFRGPQKVKVPAQLDLLLLEQVLKELVKQPPLPGQRLAWVQLELGRPVRLVFQQPIQFWLLVLVPPVQPRLVLHSEMRHEAS